MAIACGGAAASTAGGGGQPGQGGAFGGGGAGGSPATALRTCDPSGTDAYRGISVGLLRPDGTKAGDLPALASGGSEDDDITGTLAEPTRADVVTCQSCDVQTTPGLRVQITDADGGVWTLQATPADGVASWIPALHEAVGETVSLGVHFRRMFQSPASAGFVLSDSAGAIVAADAGPHLNVGTVVPGGLTLSTGAPFCARPVSCAGGTADTEDLLVFTSQTSVAVGPATDGQVTIAGRQYLARSLDAVVTSGQCPTTQATGEGTGSDPAEGGTFWMIAREPLSPGP